MTCGRSESGNSEEGGRGCIFLLFMIFLLSRSCAQQEKIEELAKRQTYPSEAHSATTKPEPPPRSYYYGPYEAPRAAEARLQAEAPPRSYYYGPYEMPPDYWYINNLEQAVHPRK